MAVPPRASAAAAAAAEAAAPAPATAAAAAVVGVLCGAAAAGHCRPASYRRRAELDPTRSRWCRADRRHCPPGSPSCRGAEERPVYQLVEQHQTMPDPHRSSLSHAGEHAADHCLAWADSARKASPPDGGPSQPQTLGRRRGDQEDWEGGYRRESRPSCPPGRVLVDAAHPFADEVRRSPRRPDGQPDAGGHGAARVGRNRHGSKHRDLCPPAGRGRGCVRAPLCPCHSCRERGQPARRRPASPVRDRPAMEYRHLASASANHLSVHSP